MFNPDAFERAEFKPRTRRVEMKTLAAFFDDDDDCCFEVRGLTAGELSKALEASKARKNLEPILEAIASQKQQVEAIRSVLGMDEETPAEIVKRLEMLVAGCVEPVLTLPIAVRIAERCPVEFFDLTNTITELTGQGSEVVKPDAALLETAS